MKKKIIFLYDSYEISEIVVEKLKNRINKEIEILNISFVRDKNIYRRVGEILMNRFDIFSFLVPILYPELERISKNDIIVNFSLLSKSLNKYLHKKYKKNYKIYWCWDLGCFKNIKQVKKCYEKIYSFDEMKAKQYNLEFLPQFYWENNFNKKMTKNDLYFVGSDKGRLKLVKKLIKNLDKNIKYKFHILRDKNKKYSLEDKKILKQTQLSYQEIIEDIKNSKCILDLTQEGQSGLTLRIMEGIFYEKKIITNNSFVKNYDFYNPNNILIIDFENEKDIKNQINAFFLKKYTSISKKIIQKYSVENWFKNIIKEN